MVKSILKRRIGVSDDAGAEKPSLQQCLEEVLEQSGALIDDVLTGLDMSTSRFRSAGGQTDSPPLVAVAIQRLIARRKEVRESFVAHLRSAVYGGGGLESQAPSMMSFESLQMLEDEQLDENIEIARAMQEIQISVDEALPPLDALMSTLLGWITVQPQINPLRPQLYVRALLECFRTFVPEAQERGAVIGPAAGRMGVGLQKLYREITDWLRSHGVEAAGATTQAMLPGAVTKAGAQPNAVTRTLLTLDRLRKLLAGDLDADGKSGRNPQDFLYTVPASLEALEDLKQVDAMVKRLTRKAERAAEDPQSRKARRVPQTSKQLGKELGEEVARMMLDNLVGDERLLPRVRDLLQVLEPVLMPLTKNDARFFSDRDHPARQFLDRVTHRSLGFTSEKDEGFAKFLRSIEDAIVVLTENAGVEGDKAPFGPALERLEGIWAKEDRVQKRRREEAAQALMHAEQRNLLAQRLSQEFRDKAEGKEVPQMVIDFLIGPWAQATAELQLTQNDGMADPQGFLALVDELVWSVQPSLAKRNRARLVELVPKMLGRLRLGLRLIKYPNERIVALFDQLIELHEQALEGGRIRVPPPEEVVAHDDDGGHADFDDTAAPEAEAGGGFWLAEHEAHEAGYLNEDAVMPMDLGREDSAAKPAAGSPASVAQLNNGSWIELMLDGTWVRAQLTWSSPHRTLFMFTSRGGQAHSMSKRTLDRLRSQGMIRLVSDGHVVDSALDAVAQVALRNTLDNRKPE